MLTSARAFNQPFTEEEVLEAVHAASHSGDGGILVSSNGHGTLFAPRENLLQKPTIEPELQACLATLNRSRRAHICISSGSSVADLASIVGLPDITYVGCFGAEMQTGGGSPILIKGSKDWIPKANRVLVAAKALIEDMGLVIVQLPLGFKIRLQGVSNLSERAKIRSLVLEKLESVAWRNSIVLVSGQREMVARAPTEFISKGLTLREQVKINKPQVVIVLGDSLTTDLPAFLEAHMLRDHYPNLYVVVIGVVDPGSPLALVSRYVDLVADGVGEVKRFLLEVEKASR